MIIPGSGSITPPALAEIPGANLAGSGTVTASFGDAITAAISQVETTSQAAKSAASELLIAGKGDVPAVALAAQRAELSLELFQQVRNKFVSAYQEIMKMPM